MYFGIELKGNSIGETDRTNGRKTLSAIMPNHNQEVLAQVR
jgi:hypothetical protein